jgi:hypothetical protein
MSESGESAYDTPPSFGSGKGPAHLVGITHHDEDHKSTKRVRCSGPNRMPRLHYGVIASIPASFYMFSGSQSVMRPSFRARAAKCRGCMSHSKRPAPGATEPSNAKQHTPAFFSGSSIDSSPVSR